MSQLRSLLASLKPKSLLPLVDLLLVNTAVVAALWIWTVRDEWRIFNSAFVMARAHWFLAVSAAWLLLAAIQDFYTQRTTRAILPTFTSLFGITASLMVLYFAIYFFAPRNNTLPRGVVLSTAIVTFFLVGVWRVAYITLSTRLFRERSRLRGEGAVIPTPLSADGGDDAPPTPADPTAHRVLTVQEVAELLKVSQATVWRWCQSGKLPAFRVGQQWRIRATDLQAMMDARERNAGAAQTGSRRR